MLPSVSVAVSEMLHVVVGVMKMLSMKYVFPSFREGVLMSFVPVMFSRLMKMFDRSMDEVSVSVNPMLLMSPDAGSAGVGCRVMFSSFGGSRSYVTVWQEGVLVCSSASVAFAQSVRCSLSVVLSCVYKKVSSTVQVSSGNVFSRTVLFVSSKKSLMFVIPEHVRVSPSCSAKSCA